MSRLGISEAFAKYGATLRNPQWSVSAWAREGSLVVSLWDHHYRKGYREQWNSQLLWVAGWGTGLLNSA